MNRLVTRRPAALGLAVALAFAMALPTSVRAQAGAPSPTPNGPPPAHGKRTFTVGFTQDIDSLNPFTGITAAAYEGYQAMYDTLTSYGAKDFGLTPGLAESWQTSPDGLTWTYKIRSGVKWSDGQPLTAHDAAYTFDRIIRGSYEKTNYGNYVANITKAEAPDDTTLVLTTKAKTPIMRHLYVYILPEHIWKKIDEKKVKSFSNEQNAVGSGPFTLIERRPGQYIRFRANPGYWGGAPHFDELVFRIFANPDSMAQALRRGEIDFADQLQSNTFNALKNQPGITTVSAKYAGFDEIAFNTGAALSDGKAIGDGNPILKDKNVRLAIAHAIDQKTLVNRVLGGYGSPGTSIIPPLYADLHYDPGPGTYGFDLAKAGQLLDQAGYPKGADGIRRSKDGKKLSFRLFGRTNSQESQQTTQYVKGWLAQIGIEVNVKIISEDSLTEKIGQGDYDMFEWGWVVEPDPDYQLSTFTCGQRSSKDGGTIYAGLSDSFICDSAYDQLYQQQAAEIDPAKRAALVKQAQQLLYEEAPYVLTYYYNDNEAYRSDRFTGFVHQPEPDGALLFQWGTYSYRNIRPVEAATASSSAGGGGNAPLYAGIAIAAVIVLGGGGLLVARRRRSATADERE